MTELEKKVASLACWRSPVELAPLKGGLTNLSYVATDGAVTGNRTTAETGAS